MNKKAGEFPAFLFLVLDSNQKLMQEILSGRLSEFLLLP
jgi:hypothetical protein